MRRFHHALSCAPQIRFDRASAYVAIEDAVSGHAFEPCAAPDGRVWIAVPSTRTVVIVANSTGHADGEALHQLRFAVAVGGHETAVDMHPFETYRHTTELRAPDGETVGRLVLEWRWSPHRARFCSGTCCGPRGDDGDEVERRVIHFTNVPEHLRTLCAPHLP